MRFLSALLAALPLTSRSPLEKRAKCLDTGVRMIVASGHGAPVHDGYGLLNSTVVDILTAIPGSTNISIPFPKNDPNQGNGVRVGMLNMQQMITNYANKCPDTPIVLLGYSQGAIITMNTLCGSSQDPDPYDIPLDADYAKNIIATVVYGDETRAPGQPYDKGTCKGGGTNERNNSAACAPFAPNIHSWCDAPDPQCCLGNNQSVHYQYANKYDGKATKFVVKQYNAFLANQTYNRMLVI